jgi:hypothetical protein
VTSNPEKDSSASFELAVVLPLGVAANQLMKVESELRFLSAKLSRYGQERGSARSEAAARLEKMSEVLDAIRRLIAEIQAEIQPQASGSTSRARSDRDD